MDKSIDKGLSIPDKVVEEYLDTCSEDVKRLNINKSGVVTSVKYQPDALRGATEGLQGKRGITGRISEKDFQEQVIDFAHLKNWKVAHFRGVRVQRRDGSVDYQTPVQADGKGFPDLIIVRGNRVVAAELKAKGGKLSPEQEVWINALLYTSIETWVWYPDDWEIIERVLE